MGGPAWPGVHAAKRFGQTRPAIGLIVHPAKAKPYGPVEDRFKQPEPDGEAEENDSPDCFWDYRQTFLFPGFQEQLVHSALRGLPPGGRQKALSRELRDFIAAGLLRLCGDGRGAVCVGAGCVLHLLGQIFLGVLR